MAINLYSKDSVDDLLAAKLSDAPVDGDTYGRKDGAWEIIAGGGGVSWGGITGTLADQTDLNTALGLLAPLASPTFTGTVTIPAGASISGYLTTASASSTYLAKASNLSDLANAGTARTNLGLGTMAVEAASNYQTVSGMSAYLTTATASSTYTTKANNLSDLASASTARTNLGLGGLAVLNDAPSNGSQYARQNGAWAVVTGGGGGSGGVNIQTFSTAGTTTWTKPAGAKYVIGYMWGSGGGGGSGARGPVTSIRTGGGGGSGGGLLKFSIDASSLSATETVVIGAGGLGGASRTTDTTAGNGGSFGGVTSFAGKVQVYPASPGGLGSLTATASGGTGSQSVIDGMVSDAGINGGGAGGSNGNSNIAGLASQYYFNASGGGGAAGSPANVSTSRQGATGGSKQVAGGGGNPGLINQIAGGSGGTTSGTLPTNGTSGSFTIGGGTGGGSGAYIALTAGQAGGNGGAWGGGGGGGSGSDNGYASGKGGDGGAGALVLITILG